VVSEQLPFELPAIATAGSVTLFRYTSYDVPFWVRGNTRPGRWHRVGDGPTQYWSMTPGAAWAELIRAEDLHSESELDELRMPLWACRFPKAGLLDLGQPEIRKVLGISERGLVNDDWTACQTLGRDIRADHPGVIAPCPALDHHWNVTMFGPRRQIDWRDRPALARTVPAVIVAVGRPRYGLLATVTRRSDPSNRLALF
jgi:RES domain-containing protein